jgi:hypothetical protein
MSRPSAKTTKPISISISPLIVSTVLFKSSYAFCTQEWFNLARDDVVSLRWTQPLVSFFGSLVGETAYTDLGRELHYLRSGVQMTTFQIQTATVNECVTRKDNSLEMGALLKINCTW